MIQTPVTVITGAAGTGKTTLITKILSAHPDKKFAILVNRLDRDMGDVERITQAGGRCLPVLGGCICCDLADSFVGAMLQITAVRDIYDHILIEACSIADPDKVMEFAHADPELAAGQIIVTCKDETDTVPFRAQANKIIAQTSAINLHELIV